MPAPLSAGDVIPASAETSYTPELTASTSNPTLGTGSNATGRYYINPLTGWVHGQIRITFGTSGTNAGSGTYRITLPTAVDQMTNATTHGRADVIGFGSVFDSSAATNSRLVVAYRLSDTGGTGGVGEIELAFLDGTNDVVDNDEPFAWAASDSISIQFAYPGA